MNTSHSTNSEPIDVVITWVDGNDPGHREKMQAFLKGVDRLKIHGAHPTRFGSVNEIKYCVLSIFKFAPFVRNVFIVTDEQDPMLYDTVKKHFPERLDSLEIVDHKEIFRGYEDCLPSFSSRAIESMIWRIDGLSDSFIYFNDDTFLVRNTDVEDYFKNHRPVLRGNWLRAPWFRVLWFKVQKLINIRLLSEKAFEPKPSYHLGQWLAAYIAGFRMRYFYFNHTPYSISRNTAESFFLNNKEIVLKNLKARFKNNNQFNFISLVYHLELLSGNKQVQKAMVAYVSPKNRSKGYIEKKINYCNNNPDIKFICVQSLDMCSIDDQKKIFAWMEKILKL